MEYLQVKTPFIEKWEKTVLSGQGSDLLDLGLLNSNFDAEDFQAKEEKHKKRKASQKGDDDSDGDKKLHNAVEKRRRDKINATIGELKQLVPSCKTLASNKAAILVHTAQYVKEVTQANSDLHESNKRLQESNSHLLAEVSELHRLLWSLHYGVNLAQVPVHGPIQHQLHAPQAPLPLSYPPPGQHFSPYPGSGAPAMPSSGPVPRLQQQ
jgi:Mg2+ and Co2+ transporter CorA